MSPREDLVTLFHLDHEIWQLQGRLVAARQQAETERAKCNELLSQQTQLDKQLQKARAHVRANEKQVEEFDQNIDERRRRMHEARNDKQYRTFAVEAESLKSDKALFEEDTLADLSRQEALEQQLTDLQQRLRHQNKRVTVEEGRLAELDEECGSRLQQLRAQRDAAASHVSKEELAVYERLADVTEGEPLAKVEENDRKTLDYTCTGCYMQVPVERINQLLTRPERVQCPNCSRILYMNADLQVALTGQ